MDTRSKIKRLDEILNRPPARVVAVVGRFDVLTAEHCHTLSEWATANTTIVALVAGDRTGAFLLDQEARAQLAAALAAVDAVLICDQIATQEALAELRPAQVVDVEATVRRDITAEVLKRHDASC